MRYVLAQVNIGRLRAPVDSPQLADFMAALDPVNAVADAAPGFVWRLQTEDGNATAVRAFEWDAAGSAGVIMNMSVWESVEALKDYTYRTAHAELLRQRQEWFEKFSGMYLALWWVPVGHVPGIDEAKERIAHLEQHGPTQFAFTFKNVFAPEDVLRLSK